MSTTTNEPTGPSGDGDAPELDAREQRQHATQARATMVGRMGAAGMPAERSKDARATLRRLTRGGGSHTGELQVHRRRGASCPRCGVPLSRRTIGGRTTYSCPEHQR